MAYAYSVLTNVGNTFEEFDTTAEAFEELGKEEFLSRIAKNTIDTLQDYLGDEVEYFLSYCDYDHVHDVAGAEEPEHILCEADKWNDWILKDLKTSLEKFEELQKEYGTISLYETIAKYMSNRQAGRTLGFSTYLYDLKKALENVENDVRFGTPCVVVNRQDDCGYSDIGTMIDPVLAEDIKEHPENYVILELLYK